MIWLRIYQEYYSLIDTSLLKTFEIMCKLLKSHKKLKTTFKILKAIQEPQQWPKYHGAYYLFVLDPVISTVIPQFV